MYNPQHPLVLALHPRSTVVEVETALKAANIMADWRYAKDKEFEQYALKDIRTLEQAKAFIAMLNADAHAMGHTSCAKTWRLKNLWRDVKKYKFLSIASHLSSVRRTCCGCHLTGSFALSPYYHSDVEKLHPRK